MEQQKTKESKKRYFAYDLMRAAAMLLIVFYHMNCEWSARLMESSLVVTKIGAQGYLGWQGVSLFILVSGAAQCISYERCSDLKTYYKKRWWSIFPSFYMAYFVCYLMGGFGGGVKLFDLSFLWTITGLDGYASLFGIQSHYLVGEWFIGMILVLYIVFPVLYALVKRYPKPTLIAAILYYLVMVQLLGNTGRVDNDILLNVVVFLARHLSVSLYEKRIASHRCGSSCSVVPSCVYPTSRACNMVFICIRRHFVVSDFYGSRKCVGSDKKFAVRDSEKTYRYAFKVFI